MSDFETEHAMSVLRSTLEATRGADRRTFLKALAAAATGSALLTSLSEVFTSTTALADTKGVTILGWGGPWKAAILNAFADPFSKASGIPVAYVSPYDYSKLKAMDQAGQQQVDLVEVNGCDTYRIIKDGITAPIDFKIVDKSKLSPGQLVHGNGVGACAVGTVMVYNKEKWPGDKGPKNWADFWDVKKFAGPRSLQRLPFPTMEFALLADGVPKDKLYPIDFDRAFKKLDEIKSNISVWFDTGSEPQQLIQNGESDITAIWTSRASDSIINHNLPYEIVWQDGASEATVESWFVLRNSPNPEGAMKFIDMAARAEMQAAFARIIYAAPTNLHAYELMDKSLAERLPTYPENEKKMFFVNFDFWTQHLDEATLRFEKWLQA